MKIGTENHGFIDRYGLERGVARIRELGYDCIDYQEFVNTETELFALEPAAFERRLAEHRRAYEGAGLEIFQVHGPWRYPPQDATAEDRAERFEKMERTLRGCALLGSKHYIIHPLMPFGTHDDSRPQERWDMNLEHFGRLCRVAEECGVIICFENMPMTHIGISRPSEILEFVKAINSPNFRVCLDTGHCSVFGESPAEAVRLLGREYLYTLHVHDNDGTRDRHWAPGEGVIDWEDFSLALQQIGYDGCLSLETSPAAALSDEESAQQELALAASARRLAGR